MSDLNKFRLQAIGFLCTPLIAFSIVYAVWALFYWPL